MANNTDYTNTSCQLSICQFQSHSTFPHENVFVFFIVGQKPRLDDFLDVLDFLVISLALPLTDIIVRARKIICCITAVTCNEILHAHYGAAVLPAGSYYIMRMLSPSAAWANVRTTPMRMRVRHEFKIQILDTVSCAMMADSVCSTLLPLSYIDSCGGVQLSMYLIGDQSQIQTSSCSHVALSKSRPKDEKEEVRCMIKA